MNFKQRWYLILPGLIILGYLIWYFNIIVLYILIATVLSLIGQPLVRLLDRIKIGKLKFPHTLSALITLLVIFGVISGIIALFFPLLINQATVLSEIDFNAIIEPYRQDLNYFNEMLVNYQLLTPDKDIETLISEKLMSFVKLTDIPELINSLIDFTGNFFIAVFSVGFITFFFLKHEKMLINAIMLVTPVKYQSMIKHVYIKIIRLLSRYFIGITLDVSIVILLISLGMWIFGFDNALIIGVSAGVMNVVPYIGPIIGAGIAIVVGITGSLEPGAYEAILPMVIKILGVLMVVNLTDAFLIQPTIYSNSVKSHPLEIFLVIMIAGSAAGITGMILAIPSYTVVRIIAKEFLNTSRFVQKITKNI